MSKFSEVGLAAAEDVLERAWTSPDRGNDISEAEAEAFAEYDDFVATEVGPWMDDPDRVAGMGNLVAYMLGALSRDPTIVVTFAALGAARVYELQQTLRELSPSTHDSPEEG